MNKAYLLVICLFLAPFTGCIDIEEPELEEEEIIRAWDFFAIEVDHNIVPNLTNHVAIGIANLGSHSATFDVSFNSSYPMHFMGEGMLSLDPGDVRILMLDINSTSDFKSANISAKMNWVGGSDSKSISLNFNYVPKGEKVEIGDTADFHYAGFLERNGHLFDTSIEYIWDNYDYFVEWTTKANRHITTIPARHIGCNGEGNPSENCEGSKGMITGFDQGMLGMYGNQTLYVVIPPEDAYGNSGNLAGETLIFSIRIASVEKKEPVEETQDYGMTVTEVVDGDTFYLGNGDKVRMLGINTPESGRPYSGEATEFLTNMILGKEVTLVNDSKNEDSDSYGRLLAHVYVDDTFVNYEIIKAGFAFWYPYTSGTDFDSEYEEAQDYASNNMAGLWIESSYNLTIDYIEYDPEGDEAEGEYVVLTNHENYNVSMVGWFLQDEAAQTAYEFDFIITNNTSIRIYTGDGADNATTLFWGWHQGIWNNSGDFAIIQDENGYMVDSYRYD